MIIGPDFVWLHFPKCAGTELEGALRERFGNDDRLQFDPIDPANVIWHQNIDTREETTSFRLGDRQVLCNIRRLPSWLLSRVHYEKARNPGLRMTREMLVDGLCVEADGSVSQADTYPWYYGSRPVSHWIRTEYLKTDVLAAFPAWMGLDEAWVNQTFQHRNAAVIPYVEDIAFWFTQAEIDHLYKACPGWAAIEQEVYGSLLRV